MGTRDHRRAARHVLLNDRHLANDTAIANRLEDRAAAQYAQRSLSDDIHREGFIAFAKQDLARFQRDRFRVVKGGQDFGDGTICYHDRWEGFDCGIKCPLVSPGAAAAARMAMPWEKRSTLECNIRRRNRKGLCRSTNAIIRVFRCFPRLQARAPRSGAAAGPGASPSCRKAGRAARRCARIFAVRR